MKKRKPVPIFTLLLIIAATGMCAFIYREMGSYSLFALNQTLIYSFCTLSLAVMLGMGGMMTFASISFFGIGAYFVANLTTGRLGLVMDSGLALLLAPAVAALFALLVGLPLLRLRGTYFTFATIGLVQVAFCFFNNFTPLFGGYDGIAGVPSLVLFGIKISKNKTWFLVLICFVSVAAILVERIRRTRLGRSLAAIRDNETAALTLGIDVYTTKIWAFCIAAALCGFGGALYAMFTRFVGADCFTYNNGIPFLVMAMLGGVNSTLGCVFGSILVGMLPEWLRILKQYMQLIYGIGVIILMIFMPMGLNGLRELIAKAVHKRKAERGKESLNV